MHRLIIWLGTQETFLPNLTLYFERKTQSGQENLSVEMIMSAALVLSFNYKLNPVI
jgi:hypothetical protein